MPSLVGSTVSHYTILEHLGGGGMGVVYKAEDTRLKRTVALKFLPPELTQDPEAKERFIHEAQAASALQHNNICVVYDIDEAADGQMFISMEHLDGETLKVKIGRGPLKIDEAIDFAIQIAQGLAKAHEHAIVHRDIKPANIMVTTDGAAKIVDFGLAKLSGKTLLTKAGSTLGTAAYMSPEQARGDTADHRTDIWSLGVVLYEMVTGKRPFEAEYERALIYSILNADAEPMTGLRTGIPMDLERIVGKAMAKNAVERYPHVEDMLVDLRTLRSGTQIRSVSHRAGRKGARRRRLIAGGAVGVIMLIAVAFAIFPHLFGPAGSTKERNAADHRTMLVVLPFENLGPPEDEYFANGTTDAITARLASVTGLGVISRQSAIQYRKSTKSIQQIGSELGVDYVLEGTVQREKPGDPASRVRVIPQLIRVSDDTHVWADLYDENMAEVFRVQSDIAERVAIQLNVTLLEPERRAIEKKPTQNLDAYELYLRAIDHVETLSISDVETAVGLLKKAVSLDPQFAEAWAGLTRAYHNLYWVFDRPGALSLEMEAAAEAEKLAPDLPETRLALGYASYARREFEKALEHFERAERARPSGDAARALCLTLRRLGKWHEALQYAEKARTLIPRLYVIYSDELGYTKMVLRRFNDAAQDFDQAISLAPHLNDAYLLKAYALTARDGNVVAAKQTMSEMMRRSNTPEAAEGTMAQGFVGPLTGATLRLFPEECSGLLDAFEKGPIERYRATQPVTVATTHIARAFVYEAMEDRPSALARFDSARTYYERIIRSNPQSAYVSKYHSYLGLAYAGLGRSAEAIREGEEAVRMVPISRDAIVGLEGLSVLAEIYVRCGKHEQAIDQIQTLLSVPSHVSPGLLRADPIWDPLRNNPRFRRLVEGK